MIQKFLKSFLKLSGKKEEKVIYRTVLYSDGTKGKMKVDMEESKKIIRKMIEEDKEMLEILKKL